MNCNTAMPRQTRSSQHLQLQPAFVLPEYNSNASKKVTQILWLDIQTTGYDPLNDHILEVSYTITNYKTEILYPLERLSVRYSECVYNSMDAETFQIYKKSHVLKRSRESTYAIHEVEEKLYDFLVKRVLKKSVKLGGSNVFFEGEFLRHHMPLVFDYLHHEMCDTKAVQMAAGLLSPTPLDDKPWKRYSHEAKTNVLESISEMMWLLKNAFKKDEDENKN
jgi:oligoribonuclease